jgi:hypothetical protein
VPYARESCDQRATDEAGAAQYRDIESAHDQRNNTMAVSPPRLI